MQQLNLALIALFAGVLTTTATAQERDRYLVPRAARETLVGMKATVHHGSAGGDYTADLTPAEVETLRRAGFAVVPAPAQPPEEGAGPADGGLASWTPYAQMRSDFEAYAAAYPAIAEFHVTGQSVQGRDIFALRISDNVQVEEDEPEVVFWANIHGDEFPSGEIAYRWAMEVLDGYGVDSALTGYVDDLEIWVIPLLNPDGHENGTRENFNGVDLNRDFGWNWDAWGGSTDAYSQPETRSLQEFCLKENVSLSATLHCEGNVFLYPWCYSPHDVPEHALVLAVGHLYAAAANYALIESWDDYETHGELLDLIHGGYGSLCYTAEISFGLAVFDTSYARNTAGMELFCSRASSTGLHGLVTDARTGQPLRATVTISGSPFPAYTDPALGDVHRLVMPGSYDVTVWANGYVPQTISGLQVVQGTATDFEVALQPGGDTYAFFVTSINQDDPNNTYNNVTLASDALGAPDGLACSLGKRGFIVVDVGASHDIADGPGADFTVTEALVPGDFEEEPYFVYAGDAYDQDVLIGFAVGTASFDLAGSGLETTRWLRIVSRSTQNEDGPLAGLELDGVTILHGIGGAFVDIGPGTAGAFGTPSLTGSGDLSPGGVGFTLQISDVAPNAFGLVFVGLNEAAVPLTVKGVSFYLDAPWLLQIPLGVGASGSLNLNGTVSSAMAGLDIALQCLWADASGPAGATGTNGLRLEIP